MADTIVNTPQPVDRAAASSSSSSSVSQSVELTSEEQSFSDALHGEVGEHAEGLGTFNGVYRPTALTILGVMMYLREGWVVGHAGLGGAVLLILAIFVITKSEEHTSELQSRPHLVCRLLLEKKKKNKK